MSHPTTPYTPIAITGMSSRLPAAQDTWQFWQNLTHAKDTIQQVPKERWLWQDFDEELGKGDNLTYSHCAGFTPMPDRFDAKFFGILPSEAQAMDPMQRLLLQASWNALEDAGYNPHDLAGQKVGVFIGVGHADYPTLLRENAVPIDAYRGTGMAITAIANKISFHFDFHGPSQSIDTACSSSLVALHRAATALHEGECDMALVGGANLLLGPELFVAFGKAGMLSRTNRCHTFDNKADGYVRGEGVAALVLTPLEIAEDNKDYIYAVLRGSAENHGGRAHSFTAPNVKSQADVMIQAWARAGLKPSDADLIESHGTGTPLGDPIEINAIKKAVSPAKHPIAIGALKSHIGHLEAAAGIAGVIKTVLSMQHGKIPANLHFNKLNKHIDLTDSTLYFPTENKPWEAVQGQSKKAGISSFGFGGVNAHVVLESSTEHHIKTDTSSQTAYLIPISAHDIESLIARAKQLINYLEEDKLAAQTHCSKRITAALQKSLNLSANEDPTFYSLSLAPANLDDLLASITKTFEIEATLKDIRGCQRPSEVSIRLAKIKFGTTAEEPLLTQHLLSKTSVPSDVICQASLKQIAYTLIHGRSSLPQRVAFICKNKSELLDSLYLFIQQPNESLEAAPSWLTGRPKSSKGVAPESAQPQSDLSIGEQEKWARYWIENKKAKLSWETIYSTEEPPNKVPLPAYPFKLERVWFKSGEKEPIESKADYILRAWKNSCPETPQFPSSQACLAYLLSELTTSKESGCLTQLTFGPPQALNTQTTIDLVYSARNNMLQCLNADTQQVFIQAQQHRSNKVEPKHLAPHNDMQGINPASIYEEFSKLGAPFNAAYQIIETVLTSSNKVELSFPEPTDKTSTTLLLSQIFSHLFAACKYLTSAKDESPYRITEISYVPTLHLQKQRLQKMCLSIEKHPQNSTLSAQVSSGDDLIFKLEGIELRPIPSAHKSESHLLTEAEA